MNTCDLAQANQSPKPTLFAFPYDWRKSNTESAAVLLQYVDCVKAVTGSDKVDILTHSLGGLLARTFILSHPGKVRKLVTIAAPWLGAPKAIKVLETGEFNENEGYFVTKLKNNPLVSNATREIYEFFNGGHELLPSRQFFNLGGRPFGEIANRKQGPVSFFEYDSFTNRLDAWYPNPGFQPGSVSKAFTANPKLTDWRDDDTGVQYYQIIGIRPKPDTKINTISVLTNKCIPVAENQYCKKQHGVYFDEGYGDGTVPELSSIRKGISSDGTPIDLSPESANKIVRKIYDARVRDSNLKEYDVQHVGMLKNTNIYAQMLEYLNAAPPQQQQRQQELVNTQAAESTVQDEEDSYHVTINSAEFVSIEDDLGRTNRTNDQISSVVTISTQGIEATLHYPSARSYTIKFYVYDDITLSNIVNIEIDKSDGSHENRSMLIRYRDLVLPRGKVVMLKLTPQGVQSLRYDNDDDGVFETEVEPTATNIGPKPLDLQGPDVLHDFTWREDGVAVALTTSDPAGVKGDTWYALDPKQADTRTNDLEPVIFTKYANGWVANPSQFPSIRVWADDNFANRANYLTNFTAPKLSQNSQSFQSTGGAGTVKVTFNEEAEELVKLRWIAISKVPWITITGGANGLATAADDKKSSSGTVTFTVAPSNTSTPRTGTLNIGGQIFTVTQEAGGDPIPPTITAPTNLTVNTSTSQCTANVNPGTLTVADNLPGVTYGGKRSDNQLLTAAYPLGVTTITWTATDAAGNTAVVTQTVSVINPVPVATLNSPATGLVPAVGAPVNFTGSFTDNPGTHTATWSFDGLTSAGTVNEATGAVTGSFTFTTAGVYKVSLTVADGCGGAGTANTIDGLDLLVVVYDPNGGWVTGGGWINSPAGAYALNPTLTGKANFGFVSKYHNGATIPTGNTEFQFKAGNLNFSSTAYEWLVIGGARAQYKGSGTINGTGDYRFMLTAIDGQEPGGGGQDKFRIRIWNNAGGGLVYDNQMNAPDNADPTTVLGGGQIVIHK